MISPHLPAETLDALLHRLDEPWVLYDAETAEKVRTANGATPEHKIHLASYEPVDEPAAPAPRGRVDAVAYMTHTSGTTGVPKLIVHSQTSMGWRVLWQQRILSAVDKDSLVAFHISPVHSRFNIGIASLMSYGFSLLNISDPSLPNVDATLRRYRPKVLETHPNHFVRWLTLVESDPSAFSSIKYLHSTFDAINKETMAKYLRASKYTVPVFLQVYGQSECGPMIMRAHTPQTLRLTNARWVGVGMPRMTKARIVDQHGRVQRRRKSGAIQMYSRGRALTYWREEERFNQNLYGQWWDSGDVGIKGYLGQIALLDRQVDLIANVESTLALDDHLLQPTRRRGPDHRREHPPVLGGEEPARQSAHDHGRRRTGMEGDRRCRPRQRWNDRPAAHARRRQRPPERQRRPHPIGTLGRHPDRDHQSRCRDAPARPTPASHGGRTAGSHRRFRTSRAPGGRGGIRRRRDPRRQRLPPPPVPLTPYEHPHR